MLQKILTMSTVGSSLRSAAIGWNYEDGMEIIKAHNEFCDKYTYYNLPVGLVGGTKDASHCYPTPLHALGRGWKLLAPPAMYEQKYEDGIHKEYEWWFTKD